MAKYKYTFYGPPGYKVGRAIVFSDEGVFETDSSTYMQLCMHPQHRVHIRRKGDPVPQAAVAQARHQGKIVVGPVSTQSLTEVEAEVEPQVDKEEAEVGSQAEVPTIEEIRDASARGLKDLCRVAGVDYGSNRTDGEAALISHYHDHEYSPLTTMGKGK